MKMLTTHTYYKMPNNILTHTFLLVICLKHGIVDTLNFSLSVSRIERVLLDTSVTENKNMQLATILNNSNIVFSVSSISLNGV